MQPDGTCGRPDVGYLYFPTTAIRHSCMQPFDSPGNFFYGPTLASNCGKSLNGTPQQ
jgi:hypothetical protein